jgi:hypothetical protein
MVLIGFGLFVCDNLVQVSRKGLVVTYVVSEACATAMLVSMKAEAEYARYKRGVMLRLKMIDAVLLSSRNFS